jgi:hypothetical protein
MNPPQFPNLKLVDLGDAEFISLRLAEHPSPVCELNFPNILIWKNSERPRYAVHQGNLCLLFEPAFEAPFFLPPVGAEKLEQTVAACLTMAPRLARVPEDFARMYGSCLRVEEDRDNFDYVYRTDELIGLRGKKYDGKRNRIKKFESTFAHEYERMTCGHIEACRRLFQDWFGDKGDGSPYMEAERDAILEALARFGDLDFKGGIVKVNGQVEAFTIGTKLEPETALIQIEIANPNLPGLAQWINREFLRHEWADCRFINREQDMGLPGLRRAKMSYQPDHLVKKYSLWPR